jgi:hypothetical protein
VRDNPHAPSFAQQKQIKASMLWLIFRKTFFCAHTSRLQVDCNRKRAPLLSSLIVCARNMLAGALSGMRDKKRSDRASIVGASNKKPFRIKMNYEIFSGSTKARLDDFLLRVGAFCRHKCRSLLPFVSSNPHTHTGEVEKVCRFSSAAI